MVKEVLECHAAKFYECSVAFVPLNYQNPNFVYITSSHKSDFQPKRPIFLHARKTHSELPYNTVFPGSSDPSYVVNYYIKWVTTSWTYSKSTMSGGHGHEMYSMYKKQ